MATPVDIGLLSKFAPVFVFLFVFFILYAILTKTKILGGAKEVNLVVSFVLAILFMLTPGVGQVVISVTPWIFILFFLIIVIVTLFLFVGVKDSSIANVFQESSIVWFLVIVILLIFGFVLSQVYGPFVQGLSGQDVSKQGITYDIARILFSSRLLTTALILVIAAQAVRLIAKNY